MVVPSEPLGNRANPWITLLRKAGWAPLAALVLHASAALLGVREAADNVVHFCGGAAAAYLAWHGCQVFAPWIGALRPAAEPVAAFAATGTAAVFVELVEFGSDRLLGTRMQHSLFETMMDLVSGVVGGVAALVALWATMRQRRGRAP